MKAAENVAPVAKVVVSLVLITPRIAKELLDKTKVALTGAAITQRPLNLTKVKKYAKDMVDGVWYVGDSICIAVNGAVIQGQHRLAAIIHSGVSVHMVVVEGVAVEAFSKFDPPEVQRTISDFLVMISGSKINTYIANRLAAVARPMLVGAKSTKKLERMDVAAHGYEHRDLILGVERALGPLEGLKMPSAITAAFCNAALAYDAGDKVLALAEAWRTEKFKKSQEPIHLAKTAVRCTMTMALTKGKRPQPRLLYRLCCHGLKAALEGRQIDDVVEDLDGFKGVG
jgi:hypothetical protein